jgi:hypothetical protein
LQARGVSQAPLDCSRDDIRALLCSMDFTRCRVATDLWPDNTTWHEAFKQALPFCALRRLGGQLLDSLHPAKYIEDPPHVVVTAPPPDLVDILLPLSHRYTTHLTCVFAPITYLRAGGKGRLQFLHHLREQGLMGLILGAPVPAGQVQAVWLILFRDRALRDLYCTMSNSAQWLRP